MKIFLCAFVFFATTAFASLTDGQCVDGRCGSDGPSPLTDISATFQAEAKLVPTLNGVSEFLHWENKDLVLYRNFKNEVQFTKIGWEPTTFTTSNQPLSRVRDSNERYLATSHDTWVNDTTSARWYHYDVPVRPVDPLFWDGDRLFSMNVNLDQSGKQRIRIYKYRVGDSSAKIACDLEAKANQIYSVAQGHSYPEVFFYRVFRKGDAYEITFYGLDVRHCKWFGMGSYTRPLAGPARNVHIFRNIKSILVEVDHPTLNLLWDSSQQGGGCRYYDIKGQKPLVPNHSVPIVVTFSKEEGFNLIFPEAKKKAKVDRLIQSVSAPVESVMQKDLWLTNDGKRLFLAPQFEVDSSRFLVHMKMGDVSELK